MKTFFEVMAMIVCVVCFFAAAVATPASVIYGLYLWGGESQELGYSAWEAAKTWLLMISCLVPGFFAYLVIK